VSRSSARNLCCTALGQATAIAKVSDFKNYTVEEHTAMKETAVMLRGTIMEMMKAIQTLEKDYLASVDHHAEYHHKG